MRKRSFSERFASVWSIGQVIGIVVFGAVDIILTLVALITFGFKETYEELGIGLAISVIALYLILRYFIRKLICVIKDDGDYFIKKTSIFEQSPGIAAAIIIVSIIMLFVVGLNANMFWGVLIFFFGCLSVVSNSFEKDD